jgi:hypothetical protein
MLSMATPQTLDTEVAEHNRFVGPQTTGRLGSSVTDLLTLQTKLRISNRGSWLGVADAVTFAPTSARNNADFLTLR